MFIEVDALSRNCALRLCKGLEGQTNRYTWWPIENLFNVFGKLFDPTKWLYLVWSNVCPRSFTTFKNIVVKKTYLQKTLNRVCLYFNLDINLHCPLPLYLRRHLNELIPTILQSNENTVIFSQYFAFGRSARGRLSFLHTFLIIYASYLKWYLTSLRLMCPSQNPSENVHILPQNINLSK